MASENTDAKEFEFVPGLQRNSALLSFVVSLVMFITGSALLLFPTPVAHIFFQETMVLQPLDMTLSRMAGAGLLAQALSCFVLLLPMYHDWSVPTKVSVDKCRTAVGLQGVLSLLFVICGLLDDRVGESGSRQSFWLLALGFGILIVSSFGLMLSFWPVLEDEEEAPANDRSGHNAAVERDTVGGNEDTEPLLSSSEEAANDEQTSYRLLEEPSEPDVAVEEEQTVDSEPTSRIRGTRRLLKLAKPEVFYLYVGCATLLVRLPFSLSIPHFVSTTLGCVARGDFDGARREILLLFILGSIDACLDFWCIFLFGYANQRIVRGVRIDTFGSILKQEMGFFDKHTSGELASRLNSDCGEMAGDLTWFFRFSIESVVRITGITAYMLVRSPALGACALSIIPVIAVVNKFYGNWLSKNASQVQDALAEANSVAQETLSCIRTVVAFASEDLEYKKYVGKVDHQYRLNIRQLFLTAIYYMCVSTFLVNTLVKSILLFVGSHLIETGRLTPEVLLAFMLYSGQLQSEMLNLFQSYSSLIKSSGAGDKVFALLDRVPPPPGTGSQVVRSSEDPVETVGSKSMSIKLENVHFSYPSRPEHPVLNGVELTIGQGQTIALVGPSGCGKSTLVNLLQRFYDPSHGRIYIDNADIKTLDVKELRRRIGVVNQDNTLFVGTILSNITYGLPDATAEQAVEAAKLANAHTFISSFPQGYNTEVGERGVQLSGGQKQRIAISRAIIRHPDLLLLDEATSALDAESEKIVQEALDSLLKANNGITTVIIAHRLRTVRNADLIAFVQDGRVVELGSHDTLMQLGGYYKEMVETSHGGQLAID